MNRRDFLQTASGAAVCAAVSSQIQTRECSAGEAARENKRSCRIVSRTPPIRWEDAMLSGNGSTGIMVLGLPLEDLIVVNHAKLWVVGTDFKPQAPDLRDAWKHAREIAQQGRYADADAYVANEAKRISREMYGGPQVKGARPWYDRTHPGFHLHVTTESKGRPRDYGRETNFETGEIAVYWTDDRGEWLRRVFVSRTDHAIVMELAAPAGAKLHASLRLSEAPGKLDGDLREVIVEHRDADMYFHATYGRTMGRAKAEGYHALGRVVAEGGKVRAVASERIEIRDAQRALLVLRLEYLDDSSAADRPALRKSLAALPQRYDALLAPHAAAHGEIFRRVSLDLGGDKVSGTLRVPPVLRHTECAGYTEDLIAQAAEGKNLPEFYELLHAAGRYALISGGTGDLPPSLMGIWGNEWSAPWDGRYTFDANLNLAIAAASQTNLPEAIETYASFLELHRDDWRQNAQKLYGCRGVVTDLCQGWRHGITLMTTYPWTGGAGWLASYLYDHFLFTGDREFLRKRVLPLLTEVAEFYEDFVRGFPEKNGRVTFYPSISPENWPVMTPAGQSTNVVPNATGEIAICRQVLTHLIAACGELKMNAEIPRWKSLLARLPDYAINADGALAEWVYPGLGDRYKHRHLSHLYAIYPSLEISPERTPELFRAARVALDKRLEFGLGEGAAHSYLHISLIAARLKDPVLMGRMLREFARLPFVNSSFTTAHYPGPHVFNLDASLCMPAVLAEMLVYSKPGAIEILPALLADMFPRGALRGLLARGAIAVEELTWNLPGREANLLLRSSETQSIVLRCGRSIRSVQAHDRRDQRLIIHDGKDRWLASLPARRTIGLRFELENRPSRDAVRGR